MIKHNRFIPVTAFALAISLGGSLSAMETVTKGTMKDPQHQSQKSSHMMDQANMRPTAASDLLGMNIDNAANEKVGEVDEIFIDSNSGEVLAVVVSTGGFLGMGEQQTLISAEDLRFSSDRTKLQTDITKDQIQSAPRHESGETSGIDRVRPLGKTASNRDARSESHRDARSDRADSRSASNANRNQDLNNSSTTSQDRVQDTNRTYGQQQQQQSRGLAVSDLIGMTVENRQGESIGDIDEVYLDAKNSEVVGVVVSTGGFLGMGDRKTLFGMSELSVDAMDDKVVLDFNREQIRGFPEYTTDDQSVFTGLRQRLDSDSTRWDRAGARYDGRNNDRNVDRDDDRSETRYADRNEARTANRTGARNVGSTTLPRPADKTVFDQGNGSDEIAMTASIRTAIRDDDELSSRANNVTIITQQGKVVLRGEVDSASEKTAIETIAHNKAGRQNVTSELRVAAR